MFGECATFGHTQGRYCSRLGVSDEALVTMPDGRKRGCCAIGGSEVFGNWVMTWVGQ